jgi:hypothetical protein
MAAQMAVLRGHSAKRALPLTEDFIDNKQFVLPEEKERLFDVELGILMLNG